MRWYGSGREIEVEVKMEHDPMKYHVKGISAKTISPPCTQMPRAVVSRKMEHLWAIIRTTRASNPFVLPRYTLSVIT